MKHAVLGLLGIGALAGTGCAALEPVRPSPVDSAPVVVEQVRDRNYEIGRPRTVVVGESLVRVREYAVRKTSATAFRVGATVQFRMGMSRGLIHRGDELPIVGERWIDGRRYRVAEIPGGVGLQVADDGAVYHKGLAANPYNGAWVSVIPDMAFDPAAPPMEEITTTASEASAGDLNYEIVFTGTDGQALRFQYREYTADNMARPAFSQELSYPRAAEAIRFRDLAIRILRVGQDDLEYVVEAD